MPNENEPKTESNPSGEVDSGKNGSKSTSPKKGFLNTVSVIFRNFLPALLAAFVMGRETFKMRIRGLPTTDTEYESPQNTRSDAESPEDENGETPLPQKRAGGGKGKLASFKQKVSSLNPFRKPEASEPDQAKDGEDEETEEIAPAAGSKKKKFILTFLITLIIIFSVCGGLYMGGMFDKEAAAESDKPATAAAAAASQKNAADTPKKGLFDTLFGKKSKTPATPKEKLEAMRITYNANNFVKYAGQNEMPVVKLFIEAGMSPDIGRTIDGFTPLMAASSFNRSKIAEFLLEKGADINAQDIVGQTALMKAVKNNRPFMMELLLKNKADHTITDKEGNTAVSLAKEFPGNNRLAEVFANFDIDISAISDAKKESSAEKALESVLPTPNKTSTPVPGPAPGQSQPKKSPYLEISVHEFLKMLEPEQASEPKTEPAPSPQQ